MKNERKGFFKQFYKEFEEVNLHPALKIFFVLLWEKGSSDLKDKIELVKKCLTLD